MTSTHWPGNALKHLSDMATDVHARIQQDFADLNPVVGLRHGMRDIDIPADAMTIDCLTSRQRIVLVLHDAHDNTLIYQFTDMDTEADAPYQQLPFDQMNSELLYQWITQHLRKTG